MTKSKLTSKQRRIRDLLISGHSMHSVARKLRLANSTVRGIAHNLEYLNEIRRIPGSSPTCISWEAPRPPATVPLGTESTITHPNTRYVPFSDGYVDKNDPEMCRVHTAGFFKFIVHTAGTMNGRILDENEQIMGEWTETVYPRGRADHKGYMTMFGDLVNFSYREGNKGSRTLAVWPKEIWLHGSDAAEKGLIMLTSRAIYVTQLLRRYGWRVSEPELRGKIHYAFNNPALASNYQKDVHIENAEVYVDTSPGESEVETENESNVNILAFLPSHIRALYAADKVMAGQIEVTQAELIEHKKKTRLIVDILKDHTEATELIAKKQTAELENQIYTHGRHDGATAGRPKDVMYG